MHPMLTTAVKAARRAGTIINRGARDLDLLTVSAKGPKDFVSEVDRAAEAAIVETLHATYPDHAILAEEGTAKGENAQAEYLWIIDPLDGTTNFIHGVPTFAVSVGLADEHGLLAGCVVDPCREEVFAAHRGGGARLNGSPMHVSRPEGLETALIATGFPFRELSRLPGYLRAFESFCRSTSGLRRAGAASLDLAYTACGRYDGFFEVGLSPWDVAAGALLVAEAGGVVTDTAGGRTYLASGSIVAAGGAIHAAMIEVTRSTLG
jgi:myo-inositol-1(or 4)-monophosphatase